MIRVYATAESVSSFWDVTAKSMAFYDALNMEAFYHGFEPGKKPILYKHSMSFRTFLSIMEEVKSYENTFNISEGEFTRL